MIVAMQLSFVLEQSNRHFTCSPKLYGTWIPAWLRFTRVQLVQLKFPIKTNPHTIRVLDHCREIYEFYFGDTEEDA